MLFNWAASRGTWQIQAAGVVLMSGPKVLAVARRGGAIIEAAGGVLRRATSPVEQLAGLVRQAHAIIEAIGTAQRQGHAPAEILAGLLVDGHVPIEFLDRVLRGTGAPAETLALLERRARATIEALADVTRQGATPLEFVSPVQTVSRAAGVPIETVTGIRRTGHTVIERRATPRRVIADTGGGWVRVRTGRPPFTVPPRMVRVTRQAQTPIEILPAIIPPRIIPRRSRAVRDREFLELVELGVL